MRRLVSCKHYCTVQLPHFNAGLVLIRAEINRNLLKFFPLCQSNDLKQFTVRLYGYLLEVVFSGKLSKKGVKGFNSRQ